MSTSSIKQAWLWANIKELTILLLIVFLIRTFGFGLYQVPTGSMETTMLSGCHDRCIDEIVKIKPFIAEVVEIIKQSDLCQQQLRENDQCFKEARRFSI